MKKPWWFSRTGAAWYLYHAPKNVLFKGNDGLWYWERKRYAKRYRETYCAPLSAREVEAINVWYAKKKAERENGGTTKS